MAKTIGQVTQTGPVASLFVLNARGATLADGKLTLTGVSPSSIAFADRPVRAAGHIETAQFVEKWNEGEDQANIDPPNATDLGALRRERRRRRRHHLRAGARGRQPDLRRGRAGRRAHRRHRPGGALHRPRRLRRLPWRRRHDGRRLPRRRRFRRRADHFTNYAHVQDPHAAWYRSDSGNRTVDYDPHNNFYGGGGYDGGGYYGHPWAAGATGLAAGAAIGAGIANRNDYYDNAYPYPYCGYPPYPPCN